MFTSHTSHVSCLKFFKTIFLKYKDGVMVRNNYNELSNVTLVGWVDKALDNLFTKHNIKLGFRVTRKYGQKIMMPWMATLKNLNNRK